MSDWDETTKPEVAVPMANIQGAQLAEFYAQVQKVLVGMDDEDFDLLVRVDGVPTARGYAYLAADARRIGLPLLARTYDERIFESLEAAWADACEARQ